MVATGQGLGLQRLSKIRQHNSKPLADAATRAMEYKGEETTEASTSPLQGEDNTGMADMRGQVLKHYGASQDTISSYLPHDFLLLLSSIEKSEKHIITTTLPTYQRVRPRNASSW